MIPSASDIREKVVSLIDEIIGDKLPDKENYTPAEKLNIILSESLQALIFVTSVEDEFNIEFDDDQVDLEFFQDVDSTVQKIQWQLNRSGNNIPFNN